MSRHLREIAALLGAGFVLAWDAAGACRRRAQGGRQGPRVLAARAPTARSTALADYKGKSAVVLAWFPKAFTGGCTKECKSFAEERQGPARA